LAAKSGSRVEVASPAAPSLAVAARKDLRLSGVLVLIISYRFRTVGLFQG
jgi:hypothetical protein